MPQIVPSGLGAAGQSADIQMEAMQNMQRISAYKQDFDQANRQMESENAFAAGVQATLRGEFSQADAGSGIESYLPETDTGRAQKAISLAGRMTNPDHAATFLEGMQGQLEQDRENKKRTEFANKLGTIDESRMPPEVMDGLLELANEDFDGARREFLKWANAEADRSAEIDKRAADIQYAQGELANAPKSAHGRITRLMHGYELGAMDQRTFHSRLNTALKFSREAEVSVSENLEEMMTALDNLPFDVENRDALEAKIQEHYMERVRGALSSSDSAGGPSVPDNAGGEDPPVETEHSRSGSIFGDMASGQKNRLIRELAGLQVSGKSEDEIEAWFKGKGLNTSEGGFSREEMLQLQQEMNFAMKRSNKNKRVKEAESRSTFNPRTHSNYRGY